MGYELWQSKRAGLRRRGTGIEDLRHLFEQRITVDCLYEPLKSCLQHDDGISVSSEMQRLDYDVIGVRQDECQPVLRKLRRTDIGAGQCGEFSTPIEPNEILASSTALSELLTVLQERAFSFVIVGSAIEGIVTRADLQKPPVRMMLFGLVSLLDMHLSYWIRRTYPNETWRKHLSNGRLTKAKELCDARRQRNEEIDELDCLQLCDKRSLAEASTALREKFGWASGTEAVSFLEAMERTRDRLAHSQFDLESGSCWSDIIKNVHSTESALSSSSAALETRLIEPTATEGEP